MPTGLTRRYGQHHLHFITFSCYRRLPLLGSVHARDDFVQVLGEMRERLGFALVGYVVMPEHVHLLIGEPPKGTPSAVLQMLKQRVSRRSRREPGRHALAAQLSAGLDSSDDSLPRFWEPRFYDFNVWSQTKKIEKLHYMHLNPVK